MSKIIIKIDVSKIDKNKIKENKYTKRDNTEVLEKNYEMEVVENKEAKLIKSGDTWELWETHFVVEKGEKGEEVKYLGKGVSFKSKAKSESVEIENPDKVPF